MTLASALYEGTVVHLRLRPRRHRLGYGVFALLVDLDELDALPARLRLLSRNRFNLFSFHDRDYGARSAEPLKAQVARHLAAAGIEGGGPIRLLTMPRMLGYAFNPLSVYFCHTPEGRLSAVLYEVSNTFGERHSYLIPVEPGTEGRVVQRTEKRFFVSPFLGMDLDYTFRLRPPGERLMVSIVARDREGTVLSAVQEAERRPLTDGALARAFVNFPLMTLKVIVGIHWEALLIWLKGIPLRPRPAPPREGVTVGQATENGERLGWRPRATRARIEAAPTQRPLGSVASAPPSSPV